MCLTLCCVSCRFDGDRCVLNLGLDPVKKMKVGRHGAPGLRLLPLSDYNIPSVYLINLKYIVLSDSGPLSLRHVEVYPYLYRGKGTNVERLGYLRVRIRVSHSRRILDGRMDKCGSVRRSKHTS